MTFGESAISEAATTPVMTPRRMAIKAKIASTSGTANHAIALRRARSIRCRNTPGSLCSTSTGSRVAEVQTNWTGNGATPSAANS